MSRWAEAFAAAIRPNDNVDSVDTVTTPPPEPAHSVNRVNTVTGGEKAAADDSDEFVRDPVRDAPSEPVLAPEPEPEAVPAAESEAEQPRSMLDWLRQRVALQRPPSFWAPAHEQPDGATCSCCRGSSWWCRDQADPAMPGQRCGSALSAIRHRSQSGRIADG